MKVGFTGTRAGMSQAQEKQLAMLLVVFGIATPETETPEFHHGGADGADTEADRLACLDGYAITVHPCPGVVADDVRDGQTIFNSHPVTMTEVFPPLVRDRHIVDAVIVLIAAPRTDKEELRSGTWATVRYARQKGIPVVMLSRGE
jgi:hypothetical protein